MYDEFVRIEVFARERRESLLRESQAVRRARVAAEPLAAAADARPDGGVSLWQRLLAFPIGLRQQGPA